MKVQDSESDPPSVSAVTESISQSESPKKDEKIDSVPPVQADWLPSGWTERLTAKGKYYITSDGTKLHTYKERN